MAIGNRLGLGLIRQRPGGTGGGGGENFLSGQTLIFDATDLSTGAFPATVANPGSFGEDIVQASTNITIANSGSPNGIKYADNPNLSFADYLHISGSVGTDFFNAGAGSIAIIGSLANTERHVVINSADPFLNIGDGADAGSEMSFRIYDTTPQYREVNATYGAQWACLFARWDGSNIYWRVARPGAAGSWASLGAGSIQSIAGNVRFLGDGVNSLNSEMNRIDFWDTAISEADADTWITTGLARITT